MFDEFSESLFQDMPDLPLLDAEEARRVLSRAYLATLQLRTGSLGEGERESLEPSVQYLKQLANSLEANLLLSADLTPAQSTACAFIAAEALALVGELLERPGGEEHTTRPRLEQSALYVRAEAALLYLIAQYDANAGTLMRHVPAAREEHAGSAVEWLFSQITSLCRLTVAPQAQPDSCPQEFTSQDQALGAPELEADTLGRLRKRLGWSIAKFLAWLGGYDDAGLDQAQEALDRLIEVLQKQPELSQGQSAVCHLAQLVRLCLDGLAQRAVLRRIHCPPNLTDSSKFDEYLLRRVRGQRDGKGSRPLLWPSATLFVETFLEEENPHAVVTMPTGSGKSFIAELALARCLHEGWCLYLVPTNALATQVRSDLRSRMAALGVSVQAFVGDSEYTNLAEERVSSVDPGTIAVMTPEKCALAQRLTPELFESLALVVFDECHLLADRSSGRGLTAELVLSQVMVSSPSVRLVLMSAMVQNPSDLAEWLAYATGSQCKAVQKPWKPTRALRAAIAIEESDYVRNGAEAERKLRSYKPKKPKAGKKPRARKNVRFHCPTLLIGGLQGTWQTTEELDYAILPLPLESPLLASRRPRGDRKEGTWLEESRGRDWIYGRRPDSWVNGSAASLSEFLVKRGIQTLTFIPKSKHFPFSVARQVKVPHGVEQELMSARAEACEILAVYELGVDSEVMSLLKRGVAVHTSLMLETEKIAAEECFSQARAQLMLATGTLAQGLNLPAIAVVIAGTEIGDSRGQSEAAVRQRTFGQLLNAAGRAGRAGFSNQGVVIAVPTLPVAFDSSRAPLSLRSELDFLQQRDSSVEVRSALTTFLHLVAQGALTNHRRAGSTELSAISILGGGGEDAPPADVVIKKTYAAFLRMKNAEEDAAEAAAERLEVIRTEFVASQGLPPWITIAAQRAGLTFWQSAALTVAFRRAVGDLTSELLASSTLEWAKRLLQIVGHLPPAHILSICAPNSLGKANREFEKVLSDPRALDVAQLDWDVPKNWLEAFEAIYAPLEAWMTGKSYAEIAVLEFGGSPGEIKPDRNDGKHPLPRTLALTHGTFGDFSRLAGGVVAIIEMLLEESRDPRLPDEVPPQVACLSLAIKNGFDSPQGLAWFRFGLRLRRPAHLLSRIFPVPLSAADDKAMRKFVDKAKLDWIRSDGLEIPRGFEERAGELAAMRLFMLSS